MGSIVFLLFFCLFLMAYPAWYAIIWFIKYRKKMTFDEFETKFNI